MHDVIVQQTEVRQDGLRHHFEGQHIFVRSIGEVDRVAVSHPNLIYIELKK